MLLFVYGLLMYGFSFYRKLLGKRFVGRGFVPGYKMYNLGLYPGVVRDGGRVYGEVYEVTASDLEDIDRAEGCDVGLYVRELVDVFFGEEGSFREKAYIYRYNRKLPSEAAVVKSGDYARYVGRGGAFNYFAYGSNVDLGRIKERGIEPLRRVPAVLEGYRLVFNKKCRYGVCANIVVDGRSRVYGVLYMLGLRDLKVLDRYEGYPRHYGRTIVRVQDREGKIYYAETYVARETHIVHGGRPSREYLRHVIGGLKEAGWVEEAKRLEKTYSQHW